MNRSSMSRRGAGVAAAPARGEAMLISGNLEPLDCSRYGQLRSDLDGRIRSGTAVMQRTDHDGPRTEPYERLHTPQWTSTRRQWIGSTAFAKRVPPVGATDVAGKILSGAQ